MTMQVNEGRLWSRLMAMAEVGPGVAGGSNRQALSDDDKAGRDLFLSWATAAGCSHEFDEIGNLWVRWPGSGDPAGDQPSVLIGSHLDTQPTGGRFDGVYGVLGGLEVIESLNDAGVDLKHPVDLVVWMNEEGSRFSVPMMGSGVWGGMLDKADVLAMTDVDGLTVAAELDRHGWGGARPASPVEHLGSFELHIEQGPILEAGGIEIGIVTGVYGVRWFTITLDGFPAHAGPTPMDQRRDPSRALARVIDRAYAKVMASADDEGFGPVGRATFALFRSEPVSPNTVPERVQVSLDMRHANLAELDRMEAAVRSIVADAAAEFGIEADVSCRSDTAPVAFAPSCIAAVTAAASDLGFSAIEIVSGAGHDACYVNHHVPTSMIFVPCEGGLSHNEAERITPVDAARGASVLLNAITQLAS